MWNIQGVKENLKEGLKNFLEYWNINEGSEGITISVSHSDCLSVCLKDKEYKITYQDDVGMFRALALLRGNLADGNAEINICEKKNFETCGIMIDCSRNAVPKLSKLKEILLKLACIGLNRCMLYTEDTYEIEGYPYFGYMRGAYTKQELKEIDDYAASLGIEMVPCIQTLGHLRYALRWPYAQNMKDTDNIVLIGNEETYQLIDNMFKTFSECFKSKNIHIGMDEAYGVGLGKYLDNNGFEDRVGIILKHLKRIKEIANKYGYTMMMWSDMFYRLCSGGDYYANDVKLPEEIEKQIPKNLDMVYWDYYNDEEKHYDSMFKRHKNICGKTVFAGGIWKWSGLSVNYKKTFDTTHPALKSAVKNNVKNVVGTIWGDDGAEVLFDTTWLGIQLYGEYNYNSDVSDEHLKTRFKQCLNCEAEQFLALEIDDYPMHWCHGDNTAFSKDVLYQDILCGLFDKNISSLPLKEYYENKLNRLNLSSGNGIIFDYYRQLLSVLILKCDIGLRISSAYKSNDKNALDVCKKDLDKLISMIKEMHKLYSKLWECENKIFGLDRIDLRVGGLISRINVAIRRINGYLSGEYDNLEELEYEKLMYGGEDVKEGKTIAATHMYDHIASASSNGVL